MFIVTGTDTQEKEYEAETLEAARDWCVQQTGGEHPVILLNFDADGRLTEVVDGEEVEIELDDDGNPVDEERFAEATELWFGQYDETAHPKAWTIGYKRDIYWYITDGVEPIRSILSEFLQPEELPEWLRPE